MTEKILNQCELNVGEKDEEELNKAKLKDSRHSTTRMSRFNSPVVNGNNKNDENLMIENNLESLPLNVDNQELLYENTTVKFRVNNCVSNEFSNNDEDNRTLSSSTSSSYYSNCSDSRRSFNGRHSSSVEISTVTKPGDDGLPIISFHFYQTNKNLNNKDNDNVDKEIKSDDIYDIPNKCQLHKVTSTISLSEIVIENRSTQQVDNIIMDHYDVPKNLKYNVPRNCKTNGESSPEISKPKNKSVDSSNDSGELFYETLECVKEKKTEYGGKSLKEESCLKVYEDVEEDKKCDKELSMSECNNNIKDKEEEKKIKKHQVEKAWNKMRKWIRDEKIKIGEVVNKHAMMQAVGATSRHNSEINLNSISSGNRSGSYDLVEAEREFGFKKVDTIDRKILESTGDLSGSKEFNNSHDLKTHKSLEFLPDYNHNENDDDDDDDDGNYDGDQERKHEKVVSKKKLQEVKGTLRKRIALFDIKDVDKKNQIKIGDDDKDLRNFVGKGTILRKRMMGSIRGIMTTAHLHQPENEETGPGGFEDIRRYVKQGGDFCKELAAILHERAELEASYAKGLSKLSTKLTKACSKDQGGNGSGGVNEAWRNVGEEMEAAAEAHRVWGIALEEQIAKPLRVGVAEAQGRSRKSIESSVDKASKSLQEWRSVAAKSKKQSFACARENERLQDIARIQSISQSQQNNNKTSNHHMTEKEVNKLENRRRKAEDSSRRADTEFYTVSVRAERARLEYESTVRKGARQMELLEEERLSALKDLANVYLAHLQALAPRLQQSADRLAMPVRNCSVSQDIDIIRNLIRRMDSNDAASVDQLLPDFYAEHVTLAMNRERRKQALVRALHLIRQDLDRERRGREGLETLHRAFIQTPAFAADESTQNVTEKLHHMRSMLTYLEAAKYKVGGALAEIEGGKRGKHPLAEHILVSRDKQGLQQSVLKMPPWAKNESFEFPDVDDDIDIHLTKDNERHDWIDRGAGDGNSENHPDEDDFSDFDEFSSQSEDNNNQDVDVNDISEIKTEGIEQCRAIYQYSANLTDELDLTPGDLITIHRKQADGWWIGECDGRTGIFPATYVQVIH